MVTAPRLSLLFWNYNQIFCETVQHFTAILCNDNKVLDTYTDSFISKVNTRLYREALSNLDNILVYRGNIAELMILKSNGMSGSVCKVLSVSLLLDRKSVV